MQYLLVTLVLGTVPMVTAHAEHIIVGAFVEKLGDSLTERLNTSLRQMALSSSSLTNRSLTVELAFGETGSPPDNFYLYETVCQTLASFSPVILLSATPCHTSDAIRQVANSYHVSVVQWQHCQPSGMLDVHRRELVAPRMSRSFSTMQVILEVVLHEQWKSMAILYDGTTDNEQLTLLQELLFASHLMTSLIDVNDMRIISPKKDALRNLHNYVVLCSEGNVLELMADVRWGHLDLVGPKYSWLIWDPDSKVDLELLADRLLEGDNVAVVQLQLCNNDSVNEDEALDEITAAVLESADYLMQHGEWSPPVFNCSGGSAWESGAAFAQQIEHRLDHCSNCSRYIIQTYGPNHHGRGSFHIAGEWSPEHSLQVPFWVFPQLNQGYNNRTFTVSSVHYPPFTIKYRNGSWGGVCMEFLHELSWLMNFSYIIQEPEDQKWGIKTENGTYSGMLGQLERREVDFGVGIFTITDEREEIVDFTTPFWVDTHIILMKKPTLTAMKILLYLRPFSTLVWCLLIIAVPVAGVIIWAVTYADPQRPQNEGRNGIYDVRVNIWQSFGALVQQGMVYVAANTSSRLVVALWWCFTIVVIALYNGNLIAFLTAPTVQAPVSTLEQLAESDMKVNLVQDGALYSVFSSATDGLYKTIYDKIRGSEDKYLVETPEEALEQVLNDHNLAHIAAKSFYDTLRERPTPLVDKQCDFVRAQEVFWPVMAAFPFQKDSPYRDEFSLNILKFLEAGLPTRWKNEWYSESIECTGLERIGSQSKITLTEAQGAFYLLGIGLLVAVVAIFTERAVFFAHRRHCSQHMLVLAHRWSRPCHPGNGIPTASSSVAVRSCDTQIISTVNLPGGGEGNEDFRTGTLKGTRARRRHSVHSGMELERPGEENLSKPTDNSRRRSSIWSFTSVGDAQDMQDAETGERTVL